MPTTALDVITAAMKEIGAVAAEETLSAAEGALGLKKLNRMLDQWNAQSLYCYAKVFSTHSWPNAQQSRTIGATGNFVVSVRPVEVLSAASVYANDVRFPMRVHNGPHDAQFWADLLLRTVSSSPPSDLYYSPDWPDGTLYLYPKPNVTLTIELETNVILAALALATTFSLPPGYENAVTYSLAEELYGVYHTPPETQVVISDLARRARAAIQGLNSKSSPTGSRDSGIPGGRGAVFDWRTGDLNR
jgi:hypothetical protein